jgi:uncharacterized protein (DUF2267 family)
MHLQHSASTSQRRLQRHLSHTGATYSHFIKHLCQVGELSPELAEAAAISVVSALQRRILPGQARHLSAQLPRRLVAFLPPARELSSSERRRFGCEAFLKRVSVDLGLELDEAERVARAVIASVRDRISEGTADDVANNLPEDLRALWRLSQ